MQPTELARIRRRVVQIKAIKKHDLIPRQVWTDHGDYFQETSAQIPRPGLKDGVAAVQRIRHKQDSQGFGFQSKDPKIFQVVPSSQVRTDHGDYVQETSDVFPLPCP